MAEGRGLVVFLTGLSGSGKSTIADELAGRLRAAGRAVTVLDGDVVRGTLTGLGFGREDREENTRRVGRMACEAARRGEVAVVAMIAPFAGAREQVRRMVGAYGDMLLVWVSTPLAECERRDRKGLYAKARAGLVGEFTGITSPYEEPADADVVVDTSAMTVGEATDVVWAHMRVE